MLQPLSTGPVLLSMIKGIRRGEVVPGTNPYGRTARLG
jgi:hypothetical protein